MLLFYFIKPFHILSLQDLELADQEDNAHVGKWRTLQRDQAITAWRKLHALAREVANSAMTVTQVSSHLKCKQRQFWILDPCEVQFPH